MFFVLRLSLGPDFSSVAKINYLKGNRIRRCISEWQVREVKGESSLGERSGQCRNLSRRNVSMIFRWFWRKNPWSENNGILSIFSLIIFQIWISKCFCFPNIWYCHEIDFSSSFLFFDFSEFSKYSETIRIFEYSTNYNWFIMWYVINIATKIQISVIISQ